MEQSSSGEEGTTNYSDGEDSDSESSVESDSENSDNSDDSVVVHEGSEVPGEVAVVPRE